MLFFQEDNDRTGAVEALQYNTVQYSTVQYTELFLLEGIQSPQYSTK